MNAIFKHVFPTVLATLVNGFLLAQELPIKPARTVSFTTTEGSYMDVDVSPDGKTLVFDLLGDLYTLPAKGGIAKQLTRGMALHTRPVWSPDGKKIAYVSDETGLPHMQVMDVTHGYKTVLGDMDGVLTLNNFDDGAANSPVYFYDAVWTPDAWEVAYGGKTYRLDGKETVPPLRVPKPLCFSSDGRSEWGVDSGHIYRYDLKAKTANPVSALLDKYLAGTISPNRQWWCYIADIGKSSFDRTSRLKLIMVNLLNNSHHVLVDSLEGGGPSRISDVVPPHFAFSPDSKSIYIGYAGKIHRIVAATGESAIVPFKANVNVDMGPYNYHTQRVDFSDFKVKYCRSASESPDGKHVVFQALSKIYMMDLPNGKPHILCLQPFGQFQPAWSPDSKWITYTSWCDTVGGFLWKVPVTGGKPEQLTKVPGQYNRPVWSPDGHSIAVLHDLNKTNGRSNGTVVTGSLEFMTLSQNAIAIVQEDKVAGLYNNLSFSNDGTKIFYTPLFTNAWHKNINELVSKDLKTGELEIVAKGDAITFSSQACMSPDGKYIVYSVDEDLFLLPQTAFSFPAVLSCQPGNQVYGIRFASGVDPHWEDGGEALAWTYGNKFYRINPNKVILAAEKKAAFQNPKDTIANAPTSVSVDPDEIIPLKVTASSTYAKGTIALKNVRIITMEGKKVIQRGTILIQNGRVTAIDQATKVAIPKRAVVYNLKGKTIMPGLIDVHLHYYPSVEICPQQDWSFITSLAYGVTTARDPSCDFDSFGYVERIRSGMMIGPRFYTVGNPVRINGGDILHCDNRADADSIVHKRLILGGSEIKNYAMPSRVQREWVLQACERYKVNMTNEGYKSPLLQLGQIKDGSTGTEHNVVWGDIHNDLIRLWAKASTYLTPTLVVSALPEEAKGFLDYKYWRYPDDKWRHFVYESNPSSSGAKYVNGRLFFNKMPQDTINAGFLSYARIDARLLKAGVNVVMGSHGNDKGIGPHDELWALQAGGLKNLEALQAATINGAKALGIQKDIGSLEVGKIADLLILDKNPLDDIHNSRDIRYVMQGGILYDANTLDELWPVKKKCPEWKLKNPSVEKGR